MYYNGGVDQRALLCQSLPPSSFLPLASTHSAMTCAVFVADWRRLRRNATQRLLFRATHHPRFILYAQPYSRCPQRVRAFPNVQQHSSQLMSHIFPFVYWTRVCARTFAVSSQKNENVSKIDASFSRFVNNNNTSSCTTDTLTGSKKQVCDVTNLFHYYM